MPKEPIILKRKIIKCDRIASIGYVETDGTVNHIISECRKVAQKGERDLQRKFKKLRFKGLYRSSKPERENE